MKTLRQELIDFNIKNDAYKFMCPTPEEILIKEVDDYLESINYELSEPEADGCNKQAKELKSDSDKVKIEIKSTHVPFIWHPPIIIDFNG